MDIFIEVVNLASAEAIRVHLASVAVHPSQLWITGYPHAYDMHIISLWSTNDLESIETNIPYQIRVYGRVLDLVIPLEIKDNVNITDHRLY